MFYDNLVQAGQVQNSAERSILLCVLGAFGCRFISARTRYFALKYG
jgi:hypothetical protein